MIDMDGARMMTGRLLTRKISKVNALPSTQARNKLHHCTQTHVCFCFRRIVAYRAMFLGLTAVLLLGCERDPLHEAVDRGDLRAAQTLIARGASPDARNEGGQTALHRASTSMRSPKQPYVTKQVLAEIAEFLIDSGACVDAKDMTGATPLHMAAMHGNLPVVKVLLAHGAAVNSGDANGYTPLYAAVAGGQRETVACLLHAGADPRISTQIDGATPLHEAAWRTGTEEIVKLLLAFGADPNSKDQKDKTPLDYAIEEQDESLVKILSSARSPDG